MLDVVIVDEDCGLLKQLQQMLPGQPMQGVTAANGVNAATLYAKSARFTDSLESLASQGVEMADSGVLIPRNALVINLLPDSAPESEQLIEKETGSTGVIVTFFGTRHEAGDVRQNPRHVHPP